MSYQKFNLEGKVGVVIGGTSGIGRAIATGLADAGADIVPVSRSPKKVRDTVNEIESMGRRSLAVPTDASLREDMETLADKVLEEFNHVDILVNSAGTLRGGPFLELTDEDFDVVMATNLRAVVLGCQIIGKIMMKQGRGKIINISSLSAFWGQPDIIPYSISKGAVAVLTKSLAVEWAKFKIQVNEIAPGFFVTPLTAEIFNNQTVAKLTENHIPMGRFGKLEDLQGAAIYLASSASDFVTGISIRVDGGVLINGKLKF
jgi:NAD(P)-dependent dehydrogenase (short-subunit alcohol dehydrogenase family)